MIPNISHDEVLDIIPPTVTNTMSEPVNNVFDKIRLTSYDVILNVKKTTRLDNETNHSQYTNILDSYPISLSNPNNINTRVFGINNLYTTPNIDLDFDTEVSSHFKATYLDQTVKKIKEEITIGSINNVEINIKRSKINTFTSLSSSNIISISYRIESETPIILQNILRNNFYEYNPNILNETYYYFENIANKNELWQHKVSENVDGTIKRENLPVLGNDINISGGTSGKYYLQNGYIINLEWDISTGRYYRKIISQTQSLGKYYLYKMNNDMYIFQASNNVNSENNDTFIKISSVVSRSQIGIPTIAISNNNKIYEISTNGIVTNPNSTVNSYKYLVNNINKLYKVDSLSLLVQYDINDYIYDTNPESNTFRKVIHNVSSNLGFDLVKNGFWKIADNTIVDNINVSENTKIYNFKAGSIDYSYFSPVNLINNSGIVYFIDQDRFVTNNNEVNNSSIIMTFTLPENPEVNYGILNKAVTLSNEIPITTDYYISSTSHIRRVSNNSEPSIFDGVYIIKNINTNISKYYSIDIFGYVNLYNGIVYDDYNYYSRIIDGINTSLDTGLYVDNIGRVISVNSGVWTNIILAQNLSNYIQITKPNQDFIIRKIININNNIILDNAPDNYTNSNALIKYNNKLYKISNFNQPVILEVGKYSQLNSKIYLSNPITGILSTIPDGLYSWVINNYSKIFQTKSGTFISIKSNNFDFFNLQTILYPLFIELKPEGVFGGLFKYDDINGSLKNISSGQYVLSNYYKIGHSLVNILDNRLCNSANQNEYLNVYYNITSEYNSALNNTLLISQQSGTTRRYILKNGISYLDVTTASLYIVRQDNSLEYWSNNAVPETSGRNIYNTYFIGYDEKLSKTGTTNNSREEIIKNNQLAVCSDGSKHIFVDGIKITPEVGTIISVNTTKTNNETAENGLMVYQQIALNVNSWTHIITQVNNSNTNIRTPRFTIVFSEFTQNTALTNAQNGDIIYITSWPDTGLFSSGVVIKGLYMLVNDTNVNNITNWVKLN